MNCTTHHICECHQEKMKLLEDRIRTLSEVVIVLFNALPNYMKRKYYTLKNSGLSQKGDK